jgi:hypothetical protein
MKQKSVIMLCLVFISTHLSAFSDEVTLTNGTKIKGRIQNATSSYVIIESEEKGTIQISHPEIKSILFSWADKVYLVSGETGTCKIVNRDPFNLIVVTGDGILSVPMSNLKMYFYQSSQDLQIPKLPTTGEDFKNEKAFPPKPLKNRFFLGLNSGWHLPPYSEWKKEFMGGAWMASAGIKAGYHIVESFTIGIGLRFDAYRYVHYEDYTSHYWTIFANSGVEYMRKIKALPPGYAFIGLDIGLLHLSGNCHLYSFREIELKEVSIAVIPKIGIRTFLNKNVTLGVEIAYFIARTGPIDLPVECGDELVISFNGISAFLSVLYYF